MSVNKVASKLKLNCNTSHGNGLPQMPGKSRTSDSNWPLRENVINISRMQEHPNGSQLLSGDRPIEWQWSSPPAAVSNVKAVLEKTPLHHMKAPCKSISPVSDIFPRKRKLIRNEESHTEPLQILVESVVNASEYSTLLDDEDAMDNCLLQCSQHVEASLAQNPQGIRPLQSTTPTSTRTHTAVSLLSSADHISKLKFNLEENISEKSSNEEGIVNKVIENKLPEENKDEKLHYVSVAVKGGCAESIVNIEKSNKDQCSSTHALSDNPIACNGGSTFQINDSYDDLLLTFCDQNVELLSQPSNQKQSENDHISQSLLKCETSVVMNVSKSSVKDNCRNDAKSTVKQISEVPGHTVSDGTLFSDGMIDDYFLPADVLKAIETAEASSQLQRVSPVQCTPEEIEKKRRQAKIKLERKKSATFNQTNRLPHAGVLKK